MICVCDTYGFLCWKSVFRRVHKIGKRYYQFLHVCLSVRSSVCPSVHPHGTTRLPPDGFLWNLIFQDFSKICRVSSSFIKIGQQKIVMYMKTNIQLLSYLAHFFWEWETFQANFVDKIKTHVLCSVPCFIKSWRCWDNVVKYCRVGQATDDNMAHALQIHKIRLCNTLFFSTVVMVSVARTRLCVTLYPSFLSCYCQYGPRCYETIF